MPEVSKEMLLEELFQLERTVAEAEKALQAVHVEAQRFLWEAHYGRLKIDRARRAYEAQVAAREYSPAADKGNMPQ